jgi:hypothetical protein
MNRRGFIRGMLMSATAGTALVKLASAEETQQLVAGPVALGNVDAEHHLPYIGSPEVFVRHNGSFLCIGFIREIRTSLGVEDAISWDGSIVLVPGLKRSELFFHGGGRREP